MPLWKLAHRKDSDMTHRRFSESRELLSIALFSSVAITTVLCLVSCDRGNRSVEEASTQNEDVHAAISTEGNDSAFLVNNFLRDVAIDGDLQDLVQIPNRFVRNTALHLRLVDSDKKQLIGLLNQTSEISRKSVQEDIRHLVVHRLSTIDPEEALRQIENVKTDSLSSLVALIFGEWALSDLVAATDHANTLQASWKFSALRGILRSRDDLSKDERRTIAAQLGVKHYSDEEMSILGDPEFVEDPDLVWDALANDAQSDLSQIAPLVRVAEAWIERDGLDAIDQIYATITDWQIRIPVLASALHTETLRHPHSTFEKVLNLEFDQGNFLVSSVIQSWATVDPYAALDAVTSIESNSLRNQLQDHIITTWGNKNPRELLANINLLASDLQTSGTEHAIVSISRSDPATAAQLFGGLDARHKKLSVPLAIATNWSTLDANAALDWVLNSPRVTGLQSELLPVVLGNLVTSNSKLAMDIALKQPVREGESGMESAVISALAKSDPYKATQLLSSVREGATKTFAYSSVGSQLIQSGAVDQALELAYDLSEKEQEQYFDSVLDYWTMTQPDELLERLGDLPSEEVQSRAALSLISFNRLRKAHSDDQVDAIKKFLTEEDREKIESDSNNIQIIKY